MDLAEKRNNNRFRLQNSTFIVPSILSCIGEDKVCTSFGQSYLLSSYVIFRFSFLASSDQGRIERKMKNGELIFYLSYDEKKHSLI